MRKSQQDYSLTNDIAQISWTNKIIHLALSHLNVHCHVHFQILRIQSATGTKRLEIAENACLRDLFESVHSLFDLDNFEFSLFKERNNKDEVTDTSQPPADPSN